MGLETFDKIGGGRFLGFFLYIRVHMFMWGGVTPPILYPHSILIGITLPNRVNMTFWGYPPPVLGAAQGGGFFQKKSKW